MVTIQELLAEARQRGASDVHISVGIPPKFRIHGILEDMISCPRLMPEDTETDYSADVDKENNGDFSGKRRSGFLLFSS